MNEFIAIPQLDSFFEELDARRKAEWRVRELRASILKDYRTVFDAERVNIGDTIRVTLPARYR